LTAAASVQHNQGLCLLGREPTRTRHTPRSASTGDGTHDGIRVLGERVTHLSGTADSNLRWPDCEQCRLRAQGGVAVTAWRGAAGLGGKESASERDQGPKQLGNWAIGNEQWATRELESCIPKDGTIPVLVTAACLADRLTCREACYFFSCKSEPRPDSRRTQGEVGGAG
jgi:hypothetical protein